MLAFRAEIARRLYFCLVCARSGGLHATETTVLARGNATSVPSGTVNSDPNTCLSDFATNHFDASSDPC